MTVYVDEVRVWPHAKHPCFMNGSAHLTADTIEELHRFASTIGLKRSWFQNHPIAAHYDLTPRKRQLALSYGATAMSAREQAKRRREKNPPELEMNAEEAARYDAIDDD